ncbi:MAG: hypothetical protein ACR2QC_07965 [Gammaproteobacteria bacterium]
MAVQQGRIVGPDNYGVVRAVWDNLAVGDTGSWVSLPQSSDLTVNCYGNFGTAGSIALEGTEDPAQAANSEGPLTDPQGVDIAMTDSRPEQVLQAPSFIRPNMGGTSGGDITCRVSARIPK